MTTQQQDPRIEEILTVAREDGIALAMRPEAVIALEDAGYICDLETGAALAGAHDADRRHKPGRCRRTVALCGPGGQGGHNPFSWRRMINRLAEPGVDLVLEDDEGWVFLLEDWEAHLERFAPAMPTIGVTVQRILADCDRRLRACARMEEQLDGQQPPGWVKRWQAEAINCKARIARSEAPARIQHGWTREANLGKVMAMPGPGGFWQMK